MIKARKDNRVVRIPDEKAETYKALGYSLFTDKDEPIYIHMKDIDKITSLEAKVKELTEALAAAEAKIAELTEGKEETKTAAKKAAK